MAAHAGTGHGASAESKGWWSTAPRKVMSKKRTPMPGLLLCIIAGRAFGRCMNSETLKPGANITKNGANQ
jgi:hypothetical protein